MVYLLYIYSPRVESLTYGIWERLGMRGMGLEEARV